MTNTKTIEDQKANQASAVQNPPVRTQAEGNNIDLDKAAAQPGHPDSVEEKQSRVINSILLW